MIVSPVFPLPKGFSQVVWAISMILTLFIILSGLVPARMFDPTSIVSGRSVLSRSVTQGTLRMQVSSCTPPESVRTTRAFCSSCKNERKSIGVSRVIPVVSRLNCLIFFQVRGWMG